MPDDLGQRLPNDRRPTIAEVAARLRGEDPRFELCLAESLASSARNRINGLKRKVDLRRSSKLQA